MKWYILPMALLVCSCQNNSVSIVSGRGKVHPISLTSRESTVAQWSNSFAWDLYAKTYEVGKSDGHCNIAASPINVSINLSMLANGAGGATRDQIIETLGFETDEIENVNSYNKKVAYNLKNVDKKVQVILASSFWKYPQLEIKDVFKNTLIENYNSDMYSITDNFVKDVSVWIKDKTGGEITNFQGHFNDPSGFYLLNSLYFKGEWTDKYGFEKSYTQKKEFDNADGSKSDVDFMYNNRVYKYNETENWQLLSIPFGEEMYYMTFLLPRNTAMVTQDGIYGLKNAFSEMIEQAYDKKVIVSIPKFKITYQVEMPKIIKELGIVDIWDPQTADLGNITNQNLCLGNFDHAVMIEVDEEGAVATAVSVSGSMYAADMPQITYFIADHPFVFCIHETSSNAILFIGTVDSL